MSSAPQDFSLQPFEEKARPEVSPRLLDEYEGLDDRYPAGGSASEAADGGVPRRKKRNTARLVWDSKPKRAPNPKNLGFQIAEVVVPNPGEAGPRLPLEPVTQEVDTSACNRLVWGDNLPVMQALLAQGYEGKINLIYIDPPFDSKADYSHSVQLTPDEAGKGGGELSADMSALERLAYRDTWEDGSDSYLDMLLPRLHLAKRLLDEHGVLFVHSDWHMNSLIRLLLDEVFGPNGHINEIAWCYSIGGKGENRFARKHDTIFLYSRSDEIYFNGKGTNVVKPRKLNSHMRLKQDEGGREYQEKTDAKTGKAYRYYVDEGKIPEDYWTDIEQLNWEDHERVGYDTQKPEKLIARIIESTTRPGDLVADFFCGSGTTAAVAEKLGRRWITSDLGKASLQVTRNRLVRLGTEGSGGIAFQREDGRTRCAPFVVENLGNYQRQMIYLNDTRLRQVGPLVLTLFGAQPHPQERNLGTQAFNDAETGRFQRRLVLVGDPDRPLSAKRVAETVALLKTLDGGGYSKLVALGWDFELNFDASLQRLLGTDTSKVEPRIIPTDVIEHLKKIPEGAGPEDREVERLREKVAFFEKPWLGQPSIQALGWVEQGDERLLRVQVRLTRYLLRSVPSGLKGFEKKTDQENRQWLQQAGGPDGLSLIDFWSLDDDLGGEDGKRPFTSTWQDLRGLGKRVRRVATATEILIQPRPGRRLGLRLVDVFGNDAAWSGLLPEG
jgi:adenine-specific DNA-methyltransferase